VTWRSLGRRHVKCRRKRPRACPLGHLSGLTALGHLCVRSPGLPGQRKRADALPKQGANDTGTVGTR